MAGVVWGGALCFWLCCVSWCVVVLGLWWVLAGAFAALWCLVAGGWLGPVETVMRVAWYLHSADHTPQLCPVP